MKKVLGKWSLLSLRKAVSVPKTSPKIVLFVYLCVCVLCFCLEHFLHNQMATNLPHGDSNSVMRQRSIAVKAQTDRLAQDDRDIDQRGTPATDLHCSPMRHKVTAAVGQLIGEPSTAS